MTKINIITYRLGVRKESKLSEDIFQSEESKKLASKCTIECKMCGYEYYVMRGAEYIRDCPVKVNYLISVV